MKIEQELNTTEREAFNLYRKRDTSAEPHTDKIHKLAFLYRENFKENEPIPDLKPFQKREFEVDVIKIYNLSQSKTQIDAFKKQGYYFKVSETATSCKIEQHLKGRKVIYWYLESTKSEYFLILLNKLKKEITERSEAVKVCIFSDQIQRIKYFDFSRTVQRHIETEAGCVYAEKNVYEADISHAYYRAAYVLGFISEETYLQIIRTLTKHDRLRLLGCIASVKVVTVYNKGKRVEDACDLIKNDLHRSAWFKICHYTDSALSELKELLGHDFLFYWVDGIYFKIPPAPPAGNKDQQDIQEELNDAYYQNYINHIQQKYNFNFVISPLPSFELKNTGQTVEIRITKQDGKQKLFFPKKEQVRVYSFVNRSIKF